MLFLILERKIQNIEKLNIGIYVLKHAGEIIDHLNENWSNY